MAARQLKYFERETKQLERKIQNQVADLMTALGAKTAGKLVDISEVASGQLQFNWGLSDREFFNFRRLPGINARGNRRGTPYQLAYADLLEDAAELGNRFKTNPVQERTLNVFIGNPVHYVRKQPQDFRSEASRAFAQAVSDLKDLF